VKCKSQKMFDIIMSTKVVCFKFRIVSGLKSVSPPSCPNLGYVTEFVEQSAQIITESTLNAF